MQLLATAIGDTGSMLQGVASLVWRPAHIILLLLVLYLRESFILHIIFKLFLSQISSILIFQPYIENGYLIAQLLSKKEGKGTVSIAFWNLAIY